MLGVEVRQETSTMLPGLLGGRQKRSGFLEQAKGYLRVASLEPLLLRLIQRPGAHCVDGKWINIRQAT